MPTLLKVSIGEASRTSSFFFENERDVVKKSVTLSPKVKQDLLDGYVGFWIRFLYENFTLSALVNKNKQNYIFSDTNMTKMDQICHLASMDRPLLNSTLY